MSIFVDLGHELHEMRLTETVSDLAALLRAERSAPDLPSSASS
jgi:hypothetical protein